MSIEQTRRDILKGGLAAAGLGVLGVPDWVLPALAQGETVVPFTDMPENFPLSQGTGDRRIIDVRKVTAALTPKDQFFTTQHYGHPAVDPATYKLKVTGLVNQPLALSLDEIRKMPKTDIVFGFECSGNRRPLQGLSSNGRWSGVPLKTVLEKAGLKANAREIVFFGADHGEEEVEFRTLKFKVDQQYGRSMPRDKALGSDPAVLLVYEMNGEPLTVHQGSPMRLLIPGWYGVANVKWLANIHVQEDQYLGKYQARWYRTLHGEKIDGETKWVERAITHMQPKSFIARVTKSGNQHNVMGIILNDGTPIKSVEIKVDDGQWQAATLDPATAKDKYGWKFFTWTWSGATPGEHTLVSRMTDTLGRVQPTAEELEVKKTFLEDNSQTPRTLVIS